MEQTEIKANKQRKVRSDKKPDTDEHTSWGTQSELRYLNGIGDSHKEVSRRSSKVVLLAGYIAGAEMRNDWGIINKDAVMEMANKLLAYADSCVGNLKMQDRRFFIHLLLRGKNRYSAAGSCEFICVRQKVV